MSSDQPLLRIEDLLKEIKEYNPQGDLELIKRAFAFAESAHGSQTRKSGEPYTQHLLHVAHLLAELKLDTGTIAASLLHDTLEDTAVTPEQLEKAFGQEIAYLVQSLTKIDKINFKTSDEETAENIRKVVLATSKDIRVILVKLADRTHNMRTLKYLPPEAQQRIAKETREIYAPIAHKLGIYKIKSELEDLAFKYLEPDAYQEIKQLIGEKKATRETKVHDLITEITDMLKAKNIPCKVSGRTKSFWSIYNKITKQKMAFEDIRDLIACRVIVRNTEDCYKVWYLIQERWKSLPQYFADYIASPKANGYQSIHAKIIYQQGIAEIQIRSLPMHQEAEAGIAAHWRYKQTERDKKFDQKIAWLKQILEWKEGLPQATARDFIDQLRIELFKDEIVVFTPKGEPITLPEGSTPIDFAYAVHSKIGDICARAKVNGELKPLDYALQSGDVIEIVTQASAKPSRQWLQFVKTPQARAKIRKALGIEGEAGKGVSGDVDTSVDVLNLLHVDSSLPLRVSRCCTLVYGEPVVAFQTKDNKVSVHNARCDNVASLIGNKEVTARWTGTPPSAETQLIITVDDQVGVAALILGTISHKDINITTINTEPRKDYAVMYIGVQVKDQATLERLLHDLRALKPVRYVSIG